MSRLKLAAIMAACCASFACGSNPPAAAPSERTPSASSSTRPDKALVAWVDGYCGAVKGLTLEVYTLPKESDIKTEADLPKVESALRRLNTKLGTAITGLAELPELSAPTQDANAIVADRLAHYRKLKTQVTEYRALLPVSGVRYAQSAVLVLGIDMVSYEPAQFASDIPAINQVMKADKDCELVA